MDRTEYLQMCKEVSLLKSIGNTKQNVPPNLLVRHDGKVYYPQSYELSFDKGETKHKAILHELQANAIVYADLSKVTKDNMPF